MVCKIQKTDDAELVADIVEETIKAVYPQHYSQSEVRFFMNLHKREHIKKMLKSEEIFLLTVDGIAAGTGTIRKNEICRLFIHPKYQHKGYGTKLMDFLEEKIFQQYDTVQVDASYFAETMYKNRGYQLCSYEKITLADGENLCYHTMAKKREKAISESYERSSFAVIITADNENM